MIFKQRLFAALLGLLFATVLTDQASALYDPGVGRFCKRDPIGYVGSAPSLYEYVDSRTLSMTDPIGLMGDLIPAKQSCAEFLSEVGAGTADVPGMPRKIRDRIRNGGDYVFCGDCQGIQNRSWPDQGKRCFICLDISAQAYPDEWIAILIHELTHCDQYGCPRRDRPIEPGKPVPIPQGPVGGGDCNKCISLERQAYKNQCSFLHAGYPEKIEACIRAGVCYSCGAACARNNRFKKGCEGKRFPWYYPQPLPYGPNA